MSSKLLIKILVQSRSKFELLKTTNFMRQDTVIDFTQSGIDLSETQPLEQNKHRNRRRDTDGLRTATFNLNLLIFILEEILNTRRSSSVQSLQSVEYFK